MPTPTPCEPLLPLLRQLREIKGLKEMQPGIFHARGDAFIHFHDEGGVAARRPEEARRLGLRSLSRSATPAEQRKLVDDAKLRARRLDDD